MSEPIKIDASEVLNNLDTFMKETLTSNLQKSLEQACMHVEGEAKRNLAGHVGSGELRASITHGIELDTDEGMVGYVGSGLEYAPYVEFGTGLYTDSSHVGRQDVPWRYQDVKGEWHTSYGIKYQHFLTNAIEQNRDKILDYFKGVLDGQ